ncbi:MAG TPA: hypothetical protein VK203_29430 [Nostocaceae cyanobacterium]|nr:hypothetical protein [Nostocaceae cyanobacterium]
MNLNYQGNNDNGTKHGADEQASGTHQTPEATKVAKAEFQHPLLGKEHYSEEDSDRREEVKHSR